MDFKFFGFLCLLFVSRAIAGTSTVSESDKTTILTEHNTYRNNVDPGAKNMMKMFWDDDLARVAEELADTCPSEHDDNAAREQSAGIGTSVGQNMAWRSVDWTAAIKLWHDEHTNFNHGSGAINSSLPIGHYTQMVLEISNGIGCAYNPTCVYDASQPFSGPTYVCNYAHQQTPSDKVTPYVESATSCVDCNTCDDKLCDCGSKVCHNGGTLNIGDCTCSCMSTFTGDECENCPSDYCQNGATASGSGGCTCNCPDGFSGTRCETNDNVCENIVDWCTYIGDENKEFWCTTYANVQRDCKQYCGLC